MYGTTGINVTYQGKAFDIFPPLRPVDRTKIVRARRSPMPELEKVRLLQFMHINKKRLLIDGFLLCLIAVWELVPLLQTNPYLVMLGYIWGVIIFGIKSKTTFRVAIILLAATPLLNLARQYTLAAHYAVLAYLFLVVGVVGTAFELRSSKRVKNHTETKSAHSIP